LIYGPPFFGSVKECPIVRFSGKPYLDPHRRKRGEERRAIGAHVVYETIRREGEDELQRPAAAQAWSGLAAGLSMGFSFIAEALLESHLPDQQWRSLISRAGYSVGFLIVILGRQQLFTENTLTVVLPFLLSKNLSTFLQISATVGRRADRQLNRHIPVRSLVWERSHSLMRTLKNA
jgi:hypothetical protein